MVSTNACAGSRNTGVSEFEYAAPAIDATYSTHHLRPPSSSVARDRVTNDSVLNSITNANGRASCEWKTAIGLTAIRSAAAIPARESTSSRPAHQMAGTVSAPASIAGERMSASDWLKMRISGQSTTEYSVPLASNPNRLNMWPNERCASASENGSSPPLRLWKPRW